ncbi:MAG TPA: hypothetical protein PLN27_15780 [Acidobacteriota bacterium]|nr:hypothetical protein [Acidobacteriota bacterium]
MFTWKPELHSDQENLRWCYLRAIEWKALPAFVSQPIIPILFIFFPWYLVLGGLLILSWLWAAIRNKFVSPSIAEYGVFFVKLKWITIPAAVIYLAYSAHYVLAGVSLFWTYLAVIFGFVPGGKTGVIQERFMKSLGYESAQETD